MLTPLSLAFSHLHVVLLGFSLIADVRQKVQNAFSVAFEILLPGMSSVWLTQTLIETPFRFGCSYIDTHVQGLDWGGSKAGLSC